jgi:hypothetical protein
MEDSSACSRKWAREEFGQLAVGDARRRARIIKMAAVAAGAPGGTVAKTFERGAERQAAYDLLEGGRVKESALLDAMAIATVDRCAQFRTVFVPIDGSSLNIVDRKKKKDFGSIGSYRSGGRGLKVVSALAVGSDGTTLGLCAQTWWSRPVVRRKRGGSKYRPVDQRESRFWVQTIDRVDRAFRDAAVTPVCVIDREGDATEILHALVSRRMTFIVRSSWNRRLATSPTTYLRPTLEARPVIATYELDVPAGFKRSARRATMELRVADVTLDLGHDWRGRRDNIRVMAVSAKEKNPPLNEKPLHWILLTNLAVRTAAAARKMVRGYTLRWRIEEFHKAWKSGVCNVERMQLHTAAAAMTWATLLAAVAVRAERLKQLARNSPDAPATIELSLTEIEALILLKRDQKKRTEVVPDGIPTIAQAVLWMAHVGCFAGKDRPGAITIGRGLEKVRTAAMILRQLKADGTIR